MGSKNALIPYAEIDGRIQECEDLLAQNKVEGGLIYIYDASCQQDSADAAAEVSEDAANELDGVATPIIIYTDSADAKDDDGGVGADSVTIWGVNEDGDGYTSDTIKTGGAGPTYTAGTVKFMRLFPPYVSVVGTEKDNVAEVAITSAAGGTEYFAIAIAKNIVGSLICWIAPGWKCKIVHMHVESAEAAVGGSMANTIIDGVRLSLAQTNGSHNETHVSNIPVTIFNAGANMYSTAETGHFEVFEHKTYPLGGVDTVPVKLQFTIETYDDGDHVLANYFVRYMLWKPKA